MTNTAKFMGDSNPLGLQSVDTWHQAQHLAFSGKTPQAIKRMRLAAKQAMGESDPGMAKYILATAAWLANDIPTVKKYISDPDVVSTGNNEVLKRLLTKTGSYRDVYLSEIDAASELDVSNFSTKNLLARSLKDGEIEGNDVMLATSGNVSVYSLVINGKVAALIGLEGVALRNIKNFSKSPGVIRALLGYLVHIKRQQINILETEPLTPDGLRWLMYLIDNPGGLKVTDRMGHSLESETVKKEWLAARSSGVAGNTAVVISENIEFGNKIRLNETRRSDTLLMPFKFYSIGNNRMKKQPKQGILRKIVNEGRYTINARTGERLHPKTGEPLPAKEKPVTMKQMFAQKPAAKKPAGLSLDQVWRKVEDVVSSVYPDGDPIDHLAPWLEKQGIKGHQVGDVLRKAAVKNGYSDVYDYFNSMGDLSEASERWVVKYWDKQSENSPAEREFSSKDRANAFLATLPADYIKSLRPSSGLRQDQGMGESYDEYEDDEQQDEGFFVVIGDEEDYSVFIGMLVKEGGKWRERTYSGNPPTNWGSTYMGYLTPQDVMSWLQKDYGRNYQVDGPFDSEEEANQHADMLREAVPSIKPREVNPDTRANILSRRKALQAIMMDPDTARDPALRREVARKKAELARMEREAGMVSEDQGGAVEAYGYAYNRKDQRVTWRRVFKSAEAAQAWAAKRNATVLGTRPVDGKQQGISEGPNDGKEDNFTIDDIKNLEQIQDLETLKARAKELIKGKPARRMKPEKISWFYNHIDNLKRPLDVIKMMYDLLLAGEGNKVIGTRHTMANNSYRQRFGEQSVEEGSEWEDETDPVVGSRSQWKRRPTPPKKEQGMSEGYGGDDRGDYHSTARAANQASRTAKSKQEHAKAADLHDRAATYGLSAGQDQSVIRDHQMAAWEHKRASKGLREGSLTEGQYEMMMRNGQVKKFVAKDDAEAKRIAKGNGAKSVIRLKGGVPAGKVLEQGVSEGSEERSQNRLWAMITDYEQRARATKNDIKKAHYMKMASELRGKLKTNDEQGVAEGLDAEAYKEKLLATLPQMLRFYEKNVKGWKPSKEQMLAAVETGYTVMKHTGDVKQAGKAVMDELNTLHRMSQGQQGVAEGFGDVVKGIKRKVAGKEDPKEVEHMYGRIARSAIKHKTPDQAEKDIGRYKKVAKVVNKKG